MKIAVIGTRGIPGIQGGVETHCQELYPRLVKLGCEVTIITRSPYVQNRNSKFQGVTLKHIFSPKRKSLEAIVHTLLAILHARTLSPDILHVHAIGPAILIPVAKLLGMTVIMTHHGPDYDRQKWGHMAKFILRLGERWGTRFADRIIVISNTIKNLIETKYHRMDCVLIPNGVNIPDKLASTAYITSLGLQNNDYIIAVGRFVPEKGFHDLVEAYRQIGNTQCKLVLVGDADHETVYSRDLKRVATENGIVLTGFIRGRHLTEIFSHARAFVMPSYHEGLPIALLEAMSYDLRLLVSDIPANLEIGLPESCYFHIGDDTDLRTKLTAMMSQPPGVSNFRNVIEDKYNWDKIAAQTLSAYRGIL